MPSIIGAFFFWPRYYSRLFHSIWGKNNAKFFLFVTYLPADSFADDVPCYAFMKVNSAGPSNVVSTPISEHAWNKRSQNYWKMNLVVSGSVRWGVSKIFSLFSTQNNKLTHEQRLRLKDDGRPCPRVTLKYRSCEAVYQDFSWICGCEEKNTYFCWPCLVMGDPSKVRIINVFEIEFDSEFR